eukprot:3140658-Amphidinium_carterae.1
MHNEIANGLDAFIHNYVLSKVTSKSVLRRLRRQKAIVSVVPTTIDAKPIYKGDKRRLAN